MLAFLLAAAALAASPAAPIERRCGWIDNPTPANWSLVDRHGDWTIMVQGGYQAEGWEDMPSMTTRGWKKTNGHYGYGCGCMKVTTDRSSHRIIRILSATPLPLRTCQRDRHLPRR